LACTGAAGAAPTRADSSLLPPADIGRTSLLPPAADQPNSPSPASGRPAEQPFSRLRQTSRTALLPLAGEGGAKRRMRARAQRAALDLLQPAGRVLTRLLFRFPQHQDQGLPRRDGASHLSLLVQRNLAQRKHPPPTRPAQRQPFSRWREKVPGGRMRVRAQRAALALLRRR